MRTIVGYIGGVITNFRGSAVSASKTLLEVCREVATNAEWSAYAAAEKLGPDVLRKQYPDDFSECVAESPAVPYHDRPYEDPVAARLSLQSKSVQRELLKRAVKKMVDEHWIAQARRAGQASRGSIDPTLLLSLNVAIDATTIELEEVAYIDLTFRPPSSDRFEELVQLIRSHEPDMDPSRDTIPDFQREIEALTHKPISFANFKAAMHAAGVSSQCLARGGRQDHRRTRNSD